MTSSLRQPINRFSVCDGAAQKPKAADSKVTAMPASEKMNRMEETENMGVYVYAFTLCVPCCTGLNGL